MTIKISCCIIKNNEDTERNKNWKAIASKLLTFNFNNNSFYQT